MSEKENLIKEALFLFLRSQNVDAAVGCVDEIVLSYVVSILEDLGSETPTSETFDITDFMEMMGAYIPQFCDIESSQVFDWIFQLAARLNSIKDSAPVTDTPVKSDNLPQSPPKAIPHGDIGKRKRKHSHKNSESSLDSDQSSLRQECGSCEEDSMQILMEMFPASCSVEIRHCLGVANGHMEQASQLILDRQESGESFTSSASSHNSKAPLGVRSQTKLDDKEMKASILDKYSYVDTDEDVREHRPMVNHKHTETKKLVRYLDSQVVTTKGEKFTEIKKDSDVDPKKFNINLKPARQYRFH